MDFWAFRRHYHNGISALSYLVPVGCPALYSTEKIRPPLKLPTTATTIATAREKRMDTKEEVLAKYLGKDFLELPTPSFVIQENKFVANCKRMFENVQSLSTATGKSIKFRAHIKTHKTVEGSLKQLGFGIVPQGQTISSILVSTLKEAQGILDYQDKTGVTYVTDICYSLPACVPEILQELGELSKRVDYLRIFVDNVEHLDNLVKFGVPPSGKKWSLFVKVDMGTHRAGVASGTTEFDHLLAKITSPEVREVADLYGFYAHAGHSYSVETIKDAHNILIEEITAVNNAAEEILKHNPKLGVGSLVLSVGATPTSNSLKLEDEADLVALVKGGLKGQLEIHCGNYCMYDLQQLSTGCIEIQEVSGFVLGTVVSSYKSRNEMLTNTGVLCLTKEQSKIPGYGLVISTNNILQKEAFDSKWYVNRLSQEHGILKPRDGHSSAPLLKLGTKVAILPQHACIVMNCFPYYFVVDDNGTVKDIWVPIRGW